MENKKIYILIFIVFILALSSVIFARKSPQKEEPQITHESGEEAEKITYQDETYNVSFSYPKEWGGVQVMPGNKICPGEDTYRTPDSLNIFDQELRFPEQDLPGTESTIRLGIRFYRMDPSKSNNCGDEALRKMATQEITGEEFSSFRLMKVNIPGFYGVYNEKASRLDTEGREQYTLFLKESDTSVLIIQPYLSFVPYFGSPELAEIDAEYPNNILEYFKKGDTAGEIRKYLGEFRVMTENIRAI